MNVLQKYSDISGKYLSNLYESDPLLDEIEKYTFDNLPNAHMISGNIQGRFLKFFASINSANNILEVGTFVGYSTICLAKGMKETGKIVSLENNIKYSKIAQGFIDKSGFKDKINLILGNAEESLLKFKENEFDFIFIDANKSKYPFYLDTCYKLLKKGGYILFDNLLWKGEVFEESKSNMAKKIDLFNKYLFSEYDTKLETFLLPIRDGISISKKN